MHQTFWKSDMRTRVDVAIAQDAEDDKAWRDCCKIVDPRDGRACRCCGKRTNPDATGLLRGHRHHVIYRSAGGPDESWNVATLCASCHDEEHVKRTLHVEGNADIALTFLRRDANGEWYVWRQEISVGVFHRD